MLWQQPLPLMTALSYRRFAAKVVLGVHQALRHENGVTRAQLLGDGAAKVLFNNRDSLHGNVKRLSSTAICGGCCHAGA